MIQISHEIPKQLFPIHDLINDYPYVLAHLLEVDKEYTEFYERKLFTAPFSILDNSAFELGKSIELNQLMHLARRFGPSHVVIPDIVNDYKGTIDQFKQFSSFRIENKDILNWLGYIGVVQGNSFEEIKNCINTYLESGVVHMIAFPFDLVPASEFVTVRYRFFTWLVQRYPLIFTRLKKKCHLLGCFNPVEFQLFRDDKEIGSVLISVDTSSPIINGWEGNVFGEHGLFGPKPKAKLAENLDIKLNNMQLETITNNVKQFRKYVNP